jgi:hypothetical protein
MKEKLEKMTIEDFEREMKDLENTPVGRFGKAIKELREKRPDIVEKAMKEYGDPPENCDPVELEEFYCRRDGYIDDALREAEWGGWRCFG